MKHRHPITEGCCAVTADLNRYLAQESARYRAEISLERDFNGAKTVLDLERCGWDADDTGHRNGFIFWEWGFGFAQWACADCGALIANAIEPDDPLPTECPHCGCCE